MTIEVKRYEIITGYPCELVNGPFVKFEDHEHALAEKDREYTQTVARKDIEILEQARELERLKNILASVDKDHAVQKLMGEYNDLLRTAVMLAENVKRNGRWQEDEWNQAIAFLATPAATALQQAKEK